MVPYVLRCSGVICKIELIEIKFHGLLFSVISFPGAYYVKIIADKSTCILSITVLIFSVK